MSTFSDLPRELLPDISDRLGLIDLLSFRGVCKTTRSASSDSSAAVESLPWFLLYGNGNPQCSLVVNNKTRRYTLNLPEIADSTCIASLDGWLLFLSSSDSSMFFFCPFSRAKINLPNCPFAFNELHFAATFTHFPTHRDCAVVVLRRSDRNWDLLELCFLRRGDSEWCLLQFPSPILEFRNILGAIHYEGKFHFLDGFDGVAIFNDKLKTLYNCYAVPVKKSDDDYDDGTRAIYHIKKKDRFESKSKEMKSILGIEEACTISICGTLISRKGCVYRLIEHEKYINGHDGRLQFKGVWIQPRFHRISPNQSWSL